jgi:hypothetical protein
LLFMSTHWSYASRCNGTCHIFISCWCIPLFLYSMKANPSPRNCGASGTHIVVHKLCQIDRWQTSLHKIATY